MASMRCCELIGICSLRLLLHRVPTVSRTSAIEFVDAYLQHEGCAPQIFDWISSALRDLLSWDALCVTFDCNLCRCPEGVVERTTVQLYNLVASKVSTQSSLWKQFARLLFPNCNAAASEPRFLKVLTMQHLSGQFVPSFHHRMHWNRFSCSWVLPHGTLPESKLCTFSSWNLRPFGNILIFQHHSNTWVFPKIMVPPNHP